MNPNRGDIVGRERELAAVGRFVDDLRTAPRDLLLEGEAGIGKTILWRAGVEAAQHAGHRVLISRPGENESRLAYSAITDLLDDAFSEAVAEAPTPQREALEIALLHRTEGSLQPDQRAIALGLLLALRTLSASSPVVVAIDDLQWVDPSSAYALSFALRRSTSSPVAILATERVGVPSSEGRNLATAIIDRDPARVQVGPLTVDDVAHVLRDRSDWPVTPPLVARIFDAAHGNPFLSLEILRALPGGAPSAGRPLPISLDAMDALRARIADLSPGARAVVLFASAMARPTLASLRTAIPDPSVLDPGLLAAEEAALVVVDGDRVDFGHPLMRSTAYWSAPSARRRAVHARLAEVADDLEERARHMALIDTGPDPDRAAFVEQAAGEARRRGAPLAAAELWELSAELTPPEDEELRCNRRRSAALERFDAGDVRRGRALQEDLIRTTTSPRQRARTRVDLAVGSYNDVDRVEELLQLALPDVGDDGHFLPLVHANLAWAALCRLEPARAVEHAREAVSLIGSDPHPVPLRVALMALASAESLLGRDPWPTIDRASGLGGDLTRGEVVLSSVVRGHLLLREGRVAEARRSIDEADRQLRETGLELVRYNTLFELAEVGCAAGEWPAAARSADEGYDIVTDSALDEIRDQMLYAKAHVAALAGRVEQARRDAQEGASIAAAQGDLLAEVWNRSVLGFIALSVGDPDEAVRVLEPAERILSEGGIEEPGAFPFIPDLAEASIAVGQLDRAKQIVDRLHDQGARLDRPLALATAARCRGLIAAALGDPPGALLELEGALLEHERVAIPFELARTLLVYGETLRRMKRKREARASLEDARSRFAALGAPLWEARAEEGLARIGGRAASPTELTETERRVAHVVAQGFTNKEAAERLFMSVKTVESNLRRIYRKLGIRSRAELARSFATSPSEGRAPSEAEHQT